MDDDITLTITERGMYVTGHGRMVNITNATINTEPARTLPETLEFLADILANDPGGIQLQHTITVRHKPRAASKVA
jgi:hypothetical protein